VILRQFVHLVDLLAKDRRCVQAAVAMLRFASTPICLAAARDTIPSPGREAVYQPRLGSESPAWRRVPSIRRRSLVGNCSAELRPLRMPDAALVYTRSRAIVLVVAARALCARVWRVSGSPSHAPRGHHVVGMACRSLTTIRRADVVVGGHGVDQPSRPTSCGSPWRIGMPRSLARPTISRTTAR